MWKAASSVKNLLSKATRSGTFSRWLNIRIKLDIIPRST
ncbi:MAG: hypothetical protein DBX65_04880 [Oscillospiraceae bacterium]|nr:MAG: hypothetical protein DBX65_04880 [Oscillospiraceae bacterium]